MSFIDLFSEKSDLYVVARPTYPAALFEWIASVAPAHERAWDCATGNGQAAVGLANHFAQVEATDASAAQIGNAMARAGVRYSVRPAEHTEFPDAHFDAVTVAQALHWFDHKRFFREVRRVLRPGGVFAAWTYNRNAITPEIDRVLSDSLYNVIRPYWAKENDAAFNGYRDVALPFERIEPPHVPMAVDWTLPEVLAHVHTWSATRRCMNERGPEFFEHAGEALARVWGDPRTPRRVTMRLEIIAGRNSDQG